MNDYKEVNFDGLVGPSHHYGGLSFGNRASMAHGASRSNPQAAALQGLEKMWTLAQRGAPQAVLPPLQRPNLPLLHSFGFGGGLAQQLESCAKHAPGLLSAVWSASNMWTANAATVFPSTDTEDGLLHLVTANLINQFHRSVEADATYRNLRAIFHDPECFKISPSLPGHPVLGDEGAANHTRLFAEDGARGIHFFVYGDGGTTALRYPARQTELASRAVARLGRLREAHCVFARQSGEAINAGVFPNDVVSVGHRDTFLYHEFAFETGATTVRRLSDVFERRTGATLQAIEVKHAAVSLEDAVSSYLFNSQLMDLPDGGHVLVVPVECEENTAVSAYLKSLVDDAATPIKEVLVQDLRESMRNGGGPACLRLRVYLSAQERSALRGRVFLDEALYHLLRDWIRRHYRSELTFDDLRDVQFVHECEAAFEALAQILRLPEVFRA